MTSDDEPLAALLKRHRAAAGLTQEELAERAGISTRSVSDAERGLRKTIYPHTATRLAEALGLKGYDQVQFESTARGRPARAGGLTKEPPRAPVTALPVPPTRLIGRHREVESILAALGRPEVRLLTLIGPGGVGKTRLALEVARRVEFADGVCFVPLAGTTEPALVTSLVADALGVIPGKDSAAVALTTHLRGRRLLLVLDTFEHVLDAAPVLASLLESCPRLAALVTSRAPLRLRAEHEIPVLPLGLPQQGSDGHPDSSPAVALFLERARAVRPELEADGDAASVVADVCRRLEGLPLAIELAAARLRHLPLAALRDQLWRQLSVLTGGPRDLPPRQRTMRDTVAWSYRLLEPQAQTLFVRLSIFAGGWTLEAAEAICGLPRSNALERMSALVDEGLVGVGGTSDGPRYGMLDVIREFAAERREEADDAADLARRHAEYFATLVQEAEPQLAGVAQEAWLRRLDAERQNIRAALRWMIDTGHAVLALRLAGAHWRTWQMRGDLAEGRSWLRQALGVEPTGHPELRTKALWGAAWLAVHQGDYEEAERSTNELLIIERRLDDPIGTRNALTVRGIVAMGRGRYAAAIPPLRECVDICRALGPSWHLATSLLNLAQPTMHVGDLARAEALLQEAKELYRDLGDRHFGARSVEYLAHTALLAGDAGRARSLFASSLREFDELEERGGIAEALAGLSAVAAADGQAARAARIAGAAEALRDSQGARPLPFEQAISERFLREARERLGEDAWNHAWVQGRSMTLDRAIEVALATS
jgi:predicted ATPase/DNA-binding XRE family transcriptional regulator